METFGTAAEPLALNGYLPFALKPGTKEPMARGYQDPLPLDKLRAAAANGSAQCGVGLLAGAKAPDGTELAFLDADIYAREPSAAVLAVLDRHLPGAASLRRVGLEPKWAVPVRVLPGTLGRTSAKFAGGHHLQLLTAGRYLAAFGTHPDTHRPYEWPERSPLDVPLAELPLLTEPVWDALCAELYEHAEFWGWQVLQDASTGGRPGDTDVAPLPKPPVDLSREQVRELVWLFRDERFSDDTWHKMGMALHHQSEGAEWGRALWVEWSGDVPPGKFGGFERWDSFGNYRGERRTLRYYLKRAKNELGWSPQRKERPVPTPEPVVLSATSIGTLADEPYNPPDVIEGLVPVDAGGLVAPGGLGKTTLDLYVGVHVMLGKACFGHEISRPGPVLYVTAEDDLRTLVGRLGAIAAALGLSPAERQLVADNFYVVDVSAETHRLLTVTRDGAHVSEWAKALVDTYRPVHPALVHLDPVSLLGPGEESGNDGMAELMRTCRWMSRELGGAVQATHHTGQAVSRERIHDQYAGRGGTAFADNARFLLQLDRQRERGFKVEGAAWRVPVDVTDEELHAGRVSVLMAHKHSYRAVREAPIVLVRTGWRFDWLDAVPGDDEATMAAESQRRLTEDGERVHRVLVEGLAGGIRYTCNQLDELREALLPGMSRGRVRAARARLEQVGMLEQAELIGVQRGARHWLKPL